MIHLSFVKPSACTAPHLVVFGRKARLAAEDVQALLPEAARAVWPAMLETLSPGDKGASQATWLAEGSVRQLVAAALPDVCSRHNSPVRPDAITSLLASNLPKKGDAAVLFALDSAEHAFAAACAVARAVPEFTRKGKHLEPSTLAISFLPAEGAVEDFTPLEAASQGVRMAAALVDMPTSELDTTVFVERARTAAEEIGAGFHCIQGQELAEGGFGGLWGVGKAAENPPALVVLSHEPAGAKKRIAWVGKGIVYDTGGLSIKGKDHMPGMKADMGGAAAVLGAFVAAVRLGQPENLYAVLCLAENAVGPASTRPDDILHMYSGKTVEINNTDAEGRLVLADGVAYAHDDLKADVIIDLATLTGAQLIATGQRHAAVICNDPELEARSVEAGRKSGDLVHPLPYCPEFFRKEFDSKVADMKNSVKDRMNAQSSCAAQFIAEHLGSFKGSWLHVDIAGPSTSGERGTGFGVGLLLTLAGLGA